MSQVNSKLQLIAGMLQRGEFAKALPLAQRAVQAEPGNGWANDLLSMALVNVGQHKQALYFAERAAKAMPDVAVAQGRYGHLLSMLGDREEGLVYALKALAMDPGKAWFVVGVATAYVNLGRYTDALRVCRAAQTHEACARDQDVTLSLSHALLNCGRADEAWDVVSRWVGEVAPSLHVLSALCHVSTYHSRGNERVEEFAALHRRYGQMLESLAQGSASFANTPDPDRRIRVGLLSPDLRSHSVSYFIEPWLAGRDASRFFVAAYSTSNTMDETSKRLKSRVDLWRDVGLKHDPAIADQVKADAIDILIDLTGHTANHRLGALSLKAAPVQATYLGYPHTTGLTRIHARLVDSITDPPGASDAWATERLVRLDPCFLCYRAPQGAAAPAAEPPCVQAGRVNFASFNSLMKVNDPLIDLWARVLERAPGSRLMLKNLSFADAALREGVREAFAKRGIDPARVECLEPAKVVSDHLAIYDRVDVALDTFPYHGTATTCEALSRGVPVVSLQGRVHLSRVGGSLLAGIRAPELIARTPEEYVAIAAGLAGDVERLRAYRRALPANLKTGALGDEAAFSRRFDGALRELWRSWCAEKRA